MAGNPFVTAVNTAAVPNKPANMIREAVASTESLAWNWQNQYMETDHTHIPSLAAQPDATMFVVGPSRRNSDGAEGTALRPVGYVQGIQAAQQRMVQRLYDFGSARAFFTVGKSSGSLSLSRLFFKGTSLLASLYSYALASTGGDGTETANSMDTHVFNKSMWSSPHAGPDLAKDTGAFFIDISSELFLNPFGCGLIYRSKAGHAIGAVYFELCMFNTHTIQMDPNSPQMMENVNIEFDRAIPMSISDSTTK